MIYKLSMVNPDNFVFIHHIVDAGDRVIRFVKGFSFETFNKDEKTISSVLYEIAVIGEAAKHTSQEFRNKYPQIPWRNIFGMRDKLVHDYMGVDYQEVWKTAIYDIPELIKILEEILKLDEVL